MHGVEAGDLIQQQRLQRLPVRAGRDVARQPRRCVASTLRCAIGAAAHIAAGGGALKKQHTLAQRPPLLLRPVGLALRLAAAFHAT